MRLLPKNILLWLVPVFGAVLFGVPRTGAETVTNDTIIKYFGKSEAIKTLHGAMTEMQEDLTSILHGFLQADERQIEDTSDRLVEKTKSAYKLKLSEPDGNSEEFALRNMLGILDEARVMQKKSKKMIMGAPTPTMSSWSISASDVIRF